MITVLIILCIGILYFTFWCIAYKIKYRCLNHIPGPKPLPFLGNILEFGRNSFDILRNIIRLDQKYGPVTKIWMGPNRVYLFITDPEIIEVFICSPNCLTKGNDYKLLKPWLGNGLLLSTGDYWQTRRKLLTPSFHFQILEEFIPIFHEQGNKLLKHFAQRVDKGVVDIYPLIQAYTLDVICETAMGTNVNAQDYPENEYVLAVKTLSDVFMERLVSVWKQIDFLFAYSNTYKKQKTALNIIHGYTKSVIKKRRNEILHVCDNKTESINDIGQKRRAAFLDVLLNATVDGVPLSDEDIREEVDTFMFEGHDTTASALSFALYEISRNPDVQNMIVDELKDIFGDDINRQPTIHELKDMKYLELVIRESARLYPSVPVFSRVLTEDIYHKDTRYPKGLCLAFQPFAMHRKERLFEDATKFKPERFLSEAILKRNPFSFIPFSAGSRNCIGQRFAMFEMKAAISSVLRHFELLPTDSIYNVVLVAELILKSSNGVSIKIQNRKW